MALEGGFIMAVKYDCILTIVRVVISHDYFLYLTKASFFIDKLQMLDKFLVLLNLDISFIFQVQSMTQSPVSCRQIIITDIQKHIEIKTFQKFLQKTSLLTQVVRFRKDNQKIYVQFCSQETAQKFIQQHNHKTKILERKLNIYYSFFEQEPTNFKLQRFQVNGIAEQKLRQTYDITKKYGPCRFQLNYNNNKLAFKCTIEFLAFHLQQDFQRLRQSFQTLDLKLRHQQAFGNINQFRCSIEITNFLPIKTLNLSLEQEESINKQLRSLIREISQHQIESVQLHSYIHRQQPQIKGYFKFKDAQLTLSQFQKIRKHFMGQPQIHTKLFYFENDANNFYTLFTLNLINTEDKPEKQFQNCLVQSFRNINPNITQILVKKQFKNYSGKIYMTDENSGKDLLSSYHKHRQHIYQFYKPNSVIRIDMFQNNKQQKKQEKYENNANKMIKQLQKHKGIVGPFGRSEHMPIQPLLSYNYPRQQNVNYKRVEKKLEYAQKKEEKYLKGAKQEQQRSKQRFKEKVVEFKQDDFPPI